MGNILSFFKKHKFYGLLVVPLLFILCLFFPNKNVDSVIPVLEEPIQSNMVEQEEKEPIIEWIYIDVKGCVQTPGVYSIEKGKRVIDAITLSGGITEVADTSNINLSRKLQDEMVIVVSSKEEILEKKKNQEQKNEPILENRIPTKDQFIEGDATFSDDSIVGDEPIVGKKVSINNATMLQLQSIPGIGEAKALSIVEYRRQKPFEKIEDLLNVKGIGETLFEQIKEFITL